MEVDNDMEQSAVEELVTVGAAGKLMQSFVDASLGAPLTPFAYIKMGHHVRLLHGRYFFLKSALLTVADTYAYLPSNGLVANDPDLKIIVFNYQSTVNAHLIKNSLEMHPFYSHYSAGLLKSKRKGHEVLKSLGAIYVNAEQLSESVKKQKELYIEFLERDLKHPEFHGSCLQDIEEHRATLQQQNVDHEAKDKVAVKKTEVKFLAEISSGLLAITLIDHDDLIDVLYDVSDVLDKIS